jgi:MSHA biogenesis protein MshP
VTCRTKRLRPRQRTTSIHIVMRQAVPSVPAWTRRAMPSAAILKRRRTPGAPAPLDRKQRGFALMAAIFVLLVLTALAAFAVRIGTTQQQSVAFDVMIARAQAAADSGIEYGANQALTASPPQCLSSTPVPLTAATLNGFSVTVTCSPSTHQVGAVTYHAYVLQSTAQQGTYGSADYVARTSTRTVNDAP